MDHVTSRPVVAHVVDKYDSGVRSVIESYVDLAREVDHRVLAGSCVGDYPPTVEVVGGGLPFRALRIRSRVRHLRPDLVHAHSSVAGAYARALLPRSTFVYQPHCYAFEALSFPWAARRLFLAVERLLARGTAVTVAVSRHEEELARSVVRAPMVRVVPNSTDLESPMPTESRLSDGADQVVVGSGRLCPQKDPVTFARVASAVRRQFPRVRFIWIGDGDSALRRILEAEGVEVTGWLGREQVRRSMLDADLMMHTAAWEGFPVSIIDAVALGLPVVALDIPSLRAEGVHTVPEAGALVDAVIRSLTDDTFQAELRSRSLKISRRMSRFEQSRHIRAVYADVLAGVV